MGAILGILNYNIVILIKKGCYRVIDREYTREYKREREKK